MKKPKTEDGNGKNKGKGHRARIGASIHGSYTIDKETHSFDYNIDARITVEEIRYAVSQIAEVIARVAAKVAEDGGLDGGRMEAAQPTVVAKPTVA